MYKRPGDRVLINALGDIRVRPSIFEVNLHSSEFLLHMSCFEVVDVESHGRLDKQVWDRALTFMINLPSTFCQIDIRLICIGLYPNVRPS